jgi:hypothetical protein
MANGVAQLGPETPRLGFKVTPGDWIIIGIAIIGLGISYAVYWGQSVYGNQASVSVSGKHWASIDLYENKTFTVKGKLGDSTLQVLDGKIRFLSSPCDGKQCIYQGWIHQSGELAACVPNAVSVRILGPDPRFDTMNF